jgi:hypothetical protein
MQSAPAPLACLQPRQFHAHADDAEDSGAVVTDYLREKLIKIGAKVVSYGRYVTFQLSEVRCRGRCLPRRFR